MVVIFRKNKVKNASISAFSILPPISDDILPRLFSEHNCSNILPKICTNMVIFGKDSFSMYTFNNISYSACLAS